MTLDYADQRYYASSYGRFNTVDPYQASAGPSDPGTWNRYSYTAGDPVNRNDRQGLLFAVCDGYEGSDDPFGGCDDGGWGGGGGGIWYDQPPSGGNGGGYKGPGGSATSPPPPPCEQLPAGATTTFLTGKGSPLASDVSQIMQVAQQDKIDPTLIAALAIAENGQKMNNPFALGPNGSSTYPTLNAAVTAVGSTLDKYIYTWNETSVS